jgi:inorganic pyrophosphatase
MPITTLLQKAERYPIQAYQKPRDRQALLRNCIAFAGTPLKHPHNRDKILLVPDPFCANTVYYEMNTEDIEFAEELPSLVTPGQETATMVRLWVRKGSLALRCTPFIVADTTGGQGTAA